MTMVIIFDRIGLQTNMNKTKSVICTPGLILGQQGAEAYKQQANNLSVKEENQGKLRGVW